MAVVHKPLGPDPAHGDRNEHVRTHVTEKVSGGFWKVGGSFSLKTLYLLEEGMSYMKTRCQETQAVKVSRLVLLAGETGGPWP